MRRIQLVFLAYLLLPIKIGASNAAMPVLGVSSETGFKVKAISGATVTENGSKFDVIARNKTSGVSFSGKWDLSGYAKIRFTIENRNSMHPLFVCCAMLDSRCSKKKYSGRINKAVKGAFEGFADVSPNQKKTIEFNLPPVLPHPDVNAGFSLMRGTPYSKALGLISYDIDLKDVINVAVAVIKASAGVEYVVSDIEFVPGKQFVPDALKMDSEHFFPFVDKYGQYKHAEWVGKVHSDKDLAKVKAFDEKDLSKNPGPENWDKWGGWSDGPKYEATGQFRVQKINGKWWMIDPDGNLFWSHGVVRVTTSCCVTPLEGRKKYFEDLPTDSQTPFCKFYHTHDNLLWPYYVARGKTETFDFSSANAYRKYGENYKEIFADLAHRRCRSWGINTMANSSDPEICAMDRTVYNERVDLGAPVEGYPAWPALKGSRGWWPFIDPFDNLFPLCVRAHLEAKISQLRDPWCLGFYVDNEIHWGNNQNFARLALEASPTQASKLVLIDELARKYHTIEALNKAWGTDMKSWEAFLNNRDHIPDKANSDLTELTNMIVRKYFSVVREVFKQVAPDKLYMGCRFASCPEYVVRIAADYVDVMSYNIYSFDCADLRLPEGLDLPIMLGEFHFGALDRGMFHPGQVTTSNQDGKGAAYEYYLRSCLNNPYIIGTNWHQFSDQPCTGRVDGENFQVGFTDCCDTPYQETVRHVRAVGYSMYEIRYGKNHIQAIGDKN